MALDFPNSPSVGSLFTSQGTTWQYDGTKWIAATSVQPSFANPNKLINPFMEIDQANEGAAVTTGIYAIDGWVASINNNTFSAQRVTDAPNGYPNSLRVTITTSHTVAAADGSSLQYRVEQNDVSDICFGTSSAQTLTLAFWVKSSVAGTYGASLRNTAANRSYIFPVVITAANTWQYVSEVIPGDTAGTWSLSGTGVGIYLDISLYAGTNNQSSTLHAWAATGLTSPNTISNTIATTVGATFQLGPCGLWIAPAAQPLLRTSFQAELARCQRYYEKSYDLGTVPGTANANANQALIYLVTSSAPIATVGASIQLSVPKRATPTLTFYSSITGAANRVRDSQNNVDVSLLATLSGTHSFYWIASLSAAATTSNMQAHWVADARL